MRVAFDPDAFMAEAWRRYKGPRPFDVAAAQRLRAKAPLQTCATCGGIWTRIRCAECLVPVCKYHRSRRTHLCIVCQEMPWGQRRGWKKGC